MPLPHLRPVAVLIFTVNYGRPRIQTGLSNYKINNFNDNIILKYS